MKLFKNILGLIVNNWKLKLVALLLAIVIYHGEKSEQSDKSNLPKNDRPLFQFSR